MSEHVTPADVMALQRPTECKFSLASPSVAESSNALFGFALLRGARIE